MSEGTCLVCDNHCSYINTCDRCRITCCILCSSYHRESCSDLKIHTYHICDVHASQVMRYCCDCDKLLCNYCLCTHTNHTCLVLTDVYQNLKTSIAAIFHDLDERIDQLSEIMTLLSYSSNSSVQLWGNGENGFQIKIKKYFKQRTEQIQECLKDASLHVTSLLEKDMFLIMFLRKWIKIKHVIIDADRHVTFLKKEAKQISIDVDINLQKAVQLISNLGRVTRFVSYAEIDSAMTSNSKSQSKIETKDEIYNAVHSRPLNDGKSSDSIRDCGMAAATCNEKETNTHLRNTISTPATKSYFEDNKHQPRGTPAQTDDISDMIDKMSNFTLSETTGKTENCLTKVDVLRRTIQNGAQITCDNSICKQTMIDCAGMKNTIKDLRHQLDSALEEIKTLKEDKMRMKVISNGMLECLRSIDTSGHPKGDWTLCVDRNVSVDDISFLQNMENVIDRFKTSKLALIDAEQKLKEKNAYYTDWTNSQLIRERILRETHKAELMKKQDEIEQYANNIIILHSRIREYELHAAANHNNQLHQDFNNLQTVYQETLQYKEQDKLILQNTVLQQKTEIDRLMHSQERLSWQISERAKTIENIEKDKNDLQLRLSSMAGDQLRKGNPAITDLSDPNRPMKIGDQFKDIYDNEWTDAMECFQTVKALFPELKPTEIEEIVIRHLYQIVKLCYKECIVTAETQMKTYESSICNICHLEIEKQDKTNLCTLPGIAEILQLRRENAEQYADKLKEMLKDRIDLKDWQYPHKNREVIDILLKSTFFDKCVTQCWFMAIQDPPMHLDDELKSGTTFDKTQYREFTSSGDKVRYVVWPALYLHKDGPLLCKGVVQAYNEL